MKPYLSERLKQIKPSPTMAISDKARELRAAGEDVISLSQGEPDFETPDHIKQAALKAMRDGHTRYTSVDGIPELKSAICTKFKQDNQLSYDQSQISVSTGGKQVLYNAFMATLNPGDEVVIPAPYWVSYPDMVVLAEGRPVFVPCPAENNFKLTAKDLEAAITPATRWLILNSPSNPTGSVYSRAELEALAGVLLRHPDVLIMTDDIYEHLIYGDAHFFTLAQVEPELIFRTLTCNGMSKTYCMTGWRIGFAGGPEPLIKAMAKLQSQSTSNPTSISQYAATAALNGGREFLAEMLAAYEERRDTVVKLLGNIEGITCATPDGAFYVYPSCAGLLGAIAPTGERLENDTAVGSYLLDAAKVTVVPGEAFGLPGHFRVSYATAIENLVEACDRIRLACEKLTLS
ncbi:MAG: aspartate aminotransferase [Proteobacteria bacterium]|jgi:aspartate aminotransferase|nr:aspartate aminotransferase [Pseudomonadota bacterium]MDP6392770.1 pyridoxal phosphate-dependent aminotransferase [Arenicellales bacterium]|tara:strand:- start:6762 stop:7973 length:1212 start_codon:yes stop_codon:yes gene_type:complete